MSLGVIRMSRCTGVWSVDELALRTALRAIGSSLSSRSYQRPGSAIRGEWVTQCESSVEIELSELNRALEICSVAGCEEGKLASQRPSPSPSNLDVLSTNPSLPSFVDLGSLARSSKSKTLR